LLAQLKDVNAHSQKPAKVRQKQKSSKQTGLHARTNFAVVRQHCHERRKRNQSNSRGNEQPLANRPPGLITRQAEANQESSHRCKVERRTDNMHCAAKGRRRSTGGCRIGFEDGRDQKSNGADTEYDQADVTDDRANLGED